MFSQRIEATSKRQTEVLQLVVYVLIKESKVITMLPPRGPFKNIQKKTLRKIPSENNSAFIKDQTYNSTHYHDHDQTYKLFLSTWNTGGIAPAEENFSLEDWLGTANETHDIYVLGFQEIVPLSASNVLSVENSGTSKISMKWNSLIRSALNKTKTKTKTKSTHQDTNHLGDAQRVYPVNKIEKSAGNKFQTKNDLFHCIISRQMVGLFISIWVRSDLRPYIRHLDVSCVGCGIMGYLGNKGSVSVRFLLHETSFCFVCCHMASGGKEGDEKHRNSDAANILSRTIFPRGPSLDLPRKILDHDRVIYLGDLNYRISLPEATTRSLVEEKEWEVLLENDQLMVELMDGQVFEGWREGEINFAPTYKYNTNSDVYYGLVQSRKGEKKRAPAWCDRILWYGQGLTQTEYDRGESRLSDHRPVRAIFTAEVELLKTTKGFKTLFMSDRLSDRFERVQSHLEVFPTDDDDEILCIDRLDHSRSIFTTYE